MGIRAGLIAASAVFGALLVSSHRDNGSMFARDPSAPVGLSLHIIICFASGGVFAVVAAPLRAFGFSVSRLSPVLLHG